MQWLPHSALAIAVAACPGLPAGIASGEESPLGRRKCAVRYCVAVSSSTCSDVSHDVTGFRPT